MLAPLTPHDLCYIYREDMIMAKPHYLVPENSAGEQADIQHAINIGSVEDAEDLFIDAKNRLLEVGEWHTNGNLSEIHFSLVDRHGHLVNRWARRGDHIRIADTIESGPPHDEHELFVVEALEYDDYPDESRETFAIRLAPADLVTGDAHPSRQDCSVILVERNGDQLSAIYHARNHELEGEDWHGLTHKEWKGLLMGLLPEG